MQRIYKDFRCSRRIVKRIRGNANGDTFGELRLTLLTNNLQKLETFNVTSSYEYNFGLVVGKTIDGDWIGVSPSIYRETHIPQKQIYRTPQNQDFSLERISQNTKNLVSQIDAIISELGTINIGSEGGGYVINYDYYMVYAASKTKESALEKTLQASKMLEISRFHSFYSDKQYFQEWEFVDELDKQDLMYQKYNQINQFMNQTFPKVMMYRFSFEIFEKIYIIGEIENGVSEAMPEAYRAGIYIKSEFIYNP
ncbi:hypothetical protein [Calothrix sp. CCY 0018]|uniref:hypothetical protein n=1 Tax=Calothrix sp. CCY 0018 TaxID=3103864 RepID=UPI0039C6A793